MLESYTGMVGMLGLEPRNPEGADLQSAAVAAVPHPHFNYQATPHGNRTNGLSPLEFRLFHASGEILRRRARSCQMIPPCRAYPNHHFCIFPVQSLCLEFYKPFYCPELRKKPEEFFLLAQNFFWSWWPGSNRRQLVYKTRALPTELHQQQVLASYPLSSFQARRTRRWGGMSNRKPPIPCQ